MSTEATNSLGLAFEQVKVSENEDENNEIEPESAMQDREKKKPYVREAVLPREKLPEQELSDRMTRIREQNEKIKQRRLDVQADEQAFKQVQEVEKAQQARTRKIQDNVDKTRQQNAERKMSKVQNREWDSGKPQQAQPSTTEENNAPDSSNAQSWSRGTRGRGRGRGGRANRGSGRPSQGNQQQDAAKEIEPAPPSTISDPTPEPESKESMVD